MDGSQKLGCVLGVPSGDTTPALEVQKRLSGAQNQEYGNDKQAVIACLAAPRAFTTR